MNDEARKIVATLNKKFGDNVVVIASDIRSDLIPRITTGSTTLDYVLGGGFPGNQWNELIGEPSHGKTAVALKTIAANQALKEDSHNCVGCCRAVGSRVRRDVRSGHQQSNCY